MRDLGAGDLAEKLDYPSLVDALAAAFQGDVTVPPRHHHTVPVANGRDATLLLMPAWDARHLGVKMVTVMPENAALNRPAVNATYQLMDRATGEVLAILDGAELTARRTASASALASRHLSRPDAQRLAMIGTGTLAPHLIGAHASQRPITEVTIWGRAPEKAAALAETLGETGLEVRAEPDLEAAVRGADIISAATLTTEPLIRGDWLSPGQHVDLVGGFTPAMREADDTALTRARVYVDTEDALVTAGDLCEPLERGVIAESDILGTLFTLADGTAPPPRPSGGEITLFKSAGTAIEDLAAAVLAYERA
ncbi:MAG: ornithine cyclodeaminase family protein [Magnetovibrio sp.]|nr:ornithine cyclodeaminase family protein [Magnetovibrio sp.]